MDFIFVPRVKISKRSRWRDSPSFLRFFLFAFIAEHRQSKILTTRKKTLGNCKESSGVLAAVPCRLGGTFWDGWDLSQATLAERLSWIEVSALNQVQNCSAWLVPWSEPKLWRGETNSRASSVCYTLWWPKKGLRFHKIMVWRNLMQ